MMMLTGTKPPKSVRSGAPAGGGRVMAVAKQPQGGERPSTSVGRREAAVGGAALALSALVAEPAVRRGTDG